jgi:hypothetical protein
MNWMTARAIAQPHALIRKTASGKDRVHFTVCTGAGMVVGIVDDCFNC